MGRTAAVLASAALAGSASMHPLGPADTWAKLHRPLHLPRVAAGAKCPVSRVDRRVDWRRHNIFGGTGIGRGPVYAGLGGSGGHLNATPEHPYGGPWAGGKVFWYVLPRYKGRVLLRGRRLDGPETLGFNGRVIPDPELRIEPGDSVSWSGQRPGSRGIPSSVRVRTSGCYGVQSDGRTFSRLIVFTVDAP